MLFHGTLHVIIAKFKSFLEPDHQLQKKKKKKNCSNSVAGLNKDTPRHHPFTSPTLI
jgi:hypothetical protein